MKVRSLWLNRCAGRALGVGLRPWLSTVRTNVTVEDQAANPLLEAGDGIFAVWHETILLAALHFRKIGSAVVVSKSRDGELIAAAARGLGWRVVRGSSSRGGAEAVRECLREQARPGPFRLAVTVDGPRGPRREVQAGAVFLAAKTGVPLVPAGFACEGRRAKSWDRMLAPRFFGRAAIRIGPPLHVPPEAAGSARRELWRGRLQAELERLTARAEADLAGAAAQPLRRAA